MKCPKCQLENRDEANFCRSCGTPIGRDIFCPNCEASNHSDSRFCEKSGAIQLEIGEFDDALNSIKG